MKIKFVICPEIPSHIKSTDYNSNLKFRKGSHDWRSLASELYAFEYIGIKTILWEENELITKYAQKGIKIPECIAVDPLNPSNNISVEVKRICGNSLPLDCSGQIRRKLRNRRDQITWPWGKTILDSFLKAHPIIINEMNVKTHHIIFVVPNSLSKKNLNKLCRHVYSHICERYLDTLNCDAVIHIIQGNDNMFDRF